MKTDLIGPIANQSTHVGIDRSARPLGTRQWPDPGAGNGWRNGHNSGEKVELAPGAEVISDHSPSRSVWMVRSGILRLQRYSFEGRRQILSLYLPGEIVGYDRPCRDGMSVETATATCLCRVDRGELNDRMEKDSGLRSDFYRQQNGQLERLRWLTWSIGALRPEERLSAFLALSTRFMPYQPLPDGGGVLTMLLGRLDIADLLATTVESISRITHSLAETGIIEIRDPAHFRIVDLRGLIGLGRIETAFDTLPFLPSDCRRIRINACANCTLARVC